MNNVLLITHGKKVCAATLDMNVAKSLQLYYSDQWERASIEEWHLEKESDINNLDFNSRKFYTVKRCHNGDSIIINEFLWNGYGVDQYVRYVNGLFKVNVMANSKEEALVKAEDKFNQFERERLGLIKT